MNEVLICNASVYLDIRKNTHFPYKTGYRNFNKVLVLCHNFSNLFIAIHNTHNLSVALPCRHSYEIAGDVRYIFNF